MSASIKQEPPSLAEEFNLVELKLDLQAKIQCLEHQIKTESENSEREYETTGTDFFAIEITEVKSENSLNTAKDETECGGIVSNVVDELYGEHEVKEELVLGPEVLQKSAPLKQLAAETVLPGEQESQESQEKPFQCLVCRESFTFENNLQVHMRTHNAARRYKCDICLKQFNGASAYDTHQRSHTRDRPFRCSICHKQFTQKQILQNHLRVHSGETPFSCEVCKKQFKQKAHLSEHKRLHTGEKPYSCDQCGREFRRKSNLHRHRWTHSNPRSKKVAKLVLEKKHEVKSYQCEVCEKLFSLKSVLRKHVKIHRKCCKFCGDVFKGRSFLAEHMRSHAGERLFPCLLCGKTFKRKGHLKMHVVLRSCAKEAG